ncbi:OTU domain-containing protein [Citrus sinensis]|uniref:OTU domain-containing protein n=1 Tax=Citrus sinensis TaxID=2711 RepID=A0ACB8IU98_CITSI|nr:OTU domain-containing protein [Citrus sinensis]
MITFEQDSDVLQWGLQLFESDPYLNCGYTNTVTPDDESYYYGQHFKEDHYETESCDVESDELIAHALQEELSQLAVSEASESPHETEENLQGPVFQHGWVNHSVGGYYSGQETGQEEADDTQPSSLCSSHEEVSYCGEEWSYPQELTDEYALDGEVGKRLNQMVPVPHVPRINGEIPSIDEATLDHQRLLERSGEWGDHVTLQAAADLYGVKIFVITSFKDTCYIEILPNVERSIRVCGQGQSQAGKGWLAMQKTTGATFRSILGSTIAASEAAGDTREKELC